MINYTSDFIFDSRNLVESAIAQKIKKAAERVAKSWPIELDGSPVKGIEDKIIFRLGFAHDTGDRPVISDNLMARIKRAAILAVNAAWSFDEESTPRGTK